MPAIGLSVKECDSNGFNTTTPNPSTVSITTNVMSSTTTDENCEKEGEMAVVAYYSAFVVLFQFGWATVQISHLSMIPDITACENTRMGLTSIRYAATVMSSILVYCITWLLLETSKFLRFKNDSTHLEFTFENKIPYLLFCYDLYSCTHYSWNRWRRDSSRGQGSI